MTPQLDGLGRAERLAPQPARAQDGDPSAQVRPGGKPVTLTPRVGMRELSERRVVETQRLLESPPCECEDCRAADEQAREEREHAPRGFWW